MPYAPDASLFPVQRTHYRASGDPKSCQGAMAALTSTTTFHSVRMEGAGDLATTAVTMINHCFPCPMDQTESQGKLSDGLQT